MDTFSNSHPLSTLVYFSDVSSHFDNKFLQHEIDMKL